MRQPQRDPDAMTEAELIQEVIKLRGERVRLQRQLRGLTAGNAWLERAAEFFADTTVRSSDILDVIRRARRRYLPEHLRDAPLSDIERTLNRQGIGAFVILLVYELAAPAIRRQVEGIVAEIARDPAAAEQYAKDPPLEHETAGTWPGNRFGQRFTRQT